MIGQKGIWGVFRYAPEKPNKARREAGRTGRPSPLSGSISGVQALDTTGIIARKARGGERLGSLPVKPNHHFNAVLAKKVTPPQLSTVISVYNFFETFTHDGK